MRPLTFTAFEDRRVTVNPARVSRVEIAAAQPPKRHAVVLVFAGQTMTEGERSMCVAEFPDREVADHVSKRIGEHLWRDDAPALDAEEERLIADNPATRDDGVVKGRRSVPTDESAHPSLRAERSSRPPVGR